MPWNILRKLVRDPLPGLFTEVQEEPLNRTRFCTLLSLAPPQRALAAFHDIAWRRRQQDQMKEK